jgi:hemerythrin superfamily protein
MRLALAQTRDLGEDARQKEERMARSSTTSSPGEAGRGGKREVIATQLLRGDHATVKQLFRRFEKAGDRALETKQRLFSEIEHALEIHAKIEEEIFYPAVANEVPAGDDLVHEAIEEHNVVKTLLGEIASMSPDDEQYDAKVKVLVENVEHHIEEEEGEMFPKAERLPELRQRELGAELKARKEALGQSTLQRFMSGMSGMTEALFGSGETEAPRRGASQKRPKGSAPSRGRKPTKRAAARARATATTKKRSAPGAAAKARASSTKKRGTHATAGRRRKTGGRATSKKR